MSFALRENICRASRLPRNDHVLMGRAEFLRPEDRLLIEAVLVRGQPTKSVARMMGVTPRTVRLRVRRLGCRLASRRFLNAVRTLRYLESRDVELARLHFCGGMSHRELSSQLGLSVHKVRRRLDKISAQIALFSKKRP